MNQTSPETTDTLWTGVVSIVLGLSAIAVFLFYTPSDESVNGTGIVSGAFLVLAGVLTMVEPFVNPSERWEAVFWIAAGLTVAGAAILFAPRRRINGVVLGVGVALVGCLRYYGVSN
ncbi:hypothetical protein [Halorussus amylolyticus]|uniref:hypothetical protein n=1 Tax=Halorussus amylolyticus TaxID=1126242 RepID=UPI001046EE76|nr:hypothetical protein [Halorussus amylolyticus]